MAMFNFDFSPEAELRRERARMELEDIRQRRAMQSQVNEERASARSRIGQGIQDIAEMSSRVTQDRVKLASLEKSLPTLEQSARSSPSASQALMMARIESKQLADGIETLERTMAVRKAILPYEMIDAGLAKQKAVDVIDGLNGLMPKDQASEPTVKFKSKRKGQNFGDEDEVSYEVPVSVADRFVQTGQLPLPSTAGSQRAAPQEDPMSFSSYNTSMLGVNPASTGEQPVDQTMLFGGGQAQASRKASLRQIHLSPPDSPPTPRAPSFGKAGKDIK